MEKRSPENIKEFVTINHHLMTAAEMAEELSLKHTYINQVCAELGIKPIKEGDRVIEFVKEHLDWTQQQIAAHFKITVTGVRYQLEKEGITLLTDTELEKQKRNKKKEIITGIKRSPEKKSTFYSSLSDDAKEYLTQITAFKDVSKPPVKRVAGVYNQSGSEFTDEVNDITTTKRVNPSAQDAFFK